MATLDEIRLQQLLETFEQQPQGIATLSQAASPLSFRYTDQLYPQYGTSDMGYAIGPYGNADTISGVPTYGYAIQPSATADSFLGSGFSGTTNMGYPFAPANRLGGLDLERFQGVSKLGRQDEDIEQVESLTEKEPSGIEKLLKFVMPGSFIGNLLGGILPKEPPEVRRVKDFYARNFGVNTAGSVGSGIMQGYNPVSGGFLNYMTGGKYGEPMQVGLGRAMQKRIENILGRKMPQTDASRARVQELRDLQLQEMQDRAAGGETLGSIGKSTFSGKGGAFEKRSGGSSGIKGTSSERNYGGR